jgi:hypothetical protein
MMTAGAEARDMEVAMRAGLWMRRGAASGAVTLMVVLAMAASAAAAPAAPVWGFAGTVRVA